jgi:membrane associated rhomboid family serine protease
MRDGNAQSEPLLNLPGVVAILIVGMATLHGVREFILSPQTDFWLLLQFAFVPARLSGWLDPAGSDGFFNQLRSGLGAGQAQMVRLLMAEGEARLWTLLTYGLLHGSWVHLMSNLFWLAAFGSPVARRLGAGRFLVLMALATIAGALAHWLARGPDVLPLVGASAAISGTTAAAMRFVFASGVPFGLMSDDASVRAIPAEPFGQLWRNSRAMMFMVIWFVTNILFGSGIVPVLGEAASIAWEAHIGGFLAGLLLFPLLDRGRVRA